MSEVLDYCECDLVVVGSPKELKKFVEFAKTPYNALDVTKFIPYPKELMELDIKAKEAERQGYYTKAGFDSGGSEWCIKNWGTRWGICDATLKEIHDDTVEYDFVTAEFPPKPVIRKMSQTFPDLEFDMRYYESSAGFRGLYVCKGGEVLLDAYHCSCGGK